VLFIVLAVLASACVPAASAAPVAVGPLGDALVTWESTQGLAGIEVSTNGVTFHPFAGAAALGPDGKPDPSVVLQVRPEIREGALRITILSNDGPARGVDPGRVEGLGEWRRLDLSRQSEAYGQTFWQKTAYSVTGDFWFTAHWVMDESDGTNWDAPSPANQGTGPFPAALRVVYAPDAAGYVLPIHEVLEFRISRNLWEIVPRPRQNPSEYRDDLASSVQLDLWGGVAEPELSHLLDVMRAISLGRFHYLSLLQNWETGGFDTLLPDSVLMPDYPPNPGIGTVAQLRDLARKGNAMGRFGLRTNYRVLRDVSPSYRAGRARFAVDAAGKSLDYLAPGDWPAIAGRQEAEIHGLFAARASFTDQLTSGACPWAWHDYAANTGSRSMRQTLERQRDLARLIRSAHQGPLGSESLMDQEMLGEFVDTGDFAIMDGYHRLFSPEFKLRRLHDLSNFQGMGLMYRFFEMPPYPQFHSGRTTFGTDPAQLDDYRACEVMYGNGAYVCYPFATWDYWLTEALLIGNLQKHYALQPVAQVYYWHDGDWATLEDLVRGGLVPNINPWAGEPTREFGRVRTRYANGLTVVVNRLPEPLLVPDAVPEPVTLPRSGWVAWKPDGSLLAFSATWPGTDHRVDYLRDRNAGLEFIHPRGQEVNGASLPTLRLHGQPAVVANVAANVVTVNGHDMPLDLPRPRSATTITYDFAESLEGWRLGEGVLTGAVEGGVLDLGIVSPDPQLYSAPLAVPAGSAPWIELRLKTSAGDLAQLYFVTDADPVTGEDKVFRVTLVPDNEYHAYRIHAAEHPAWKGTITGLRLDPVHGPAQARVSIDYLRAGPDGQ
jgi:hypothetical protein